MTPGGPISPTTVVERRATARGEWVLRERVGSGGEKTFEMIANGVFLMDSVDHGTEAALARVAMEELPPGGAVVVAGLGFGYTLRAVLDDPRVGAVSVVEVEPAVVRWVRGPVAALAGAPLDDSRVRIVERDLQAHLKSAPEPCHALLLDVDNGPEFLVHEGNGWLYGPGGLAAARRWLAPSGRLAIWSSEPSPRCLGALREVFGNGREVALPVEREGRKLRYFLYVADR